MINFRFHLVSITAIFLALAAGIAIGAAVVDQGSVNLLRTQIDEVEARRQETNARNDELKARLGDWDQYAGELGNRLLAGTLAGDDGGAGVPVLIAAVDGVDREQIGRMADAVIAAGASYQGTVYLGRKWALPDEESADQLATALSIGTDLGKETVRRAAVARLGRALASGDPTDLLVSLQGQGFVEHAPPELGPELAAVPTGDATIIFVSGPGAKVDDELLALPVVEAMAAAERPFLAVQPGTPVERDGAGADPFVVQIRRNPELATRVTTVDSIQDHRGQAAAVLAILATRAGNVGHYGLGAGAERIVPEAPQPPAP